MLVISALGGYVFGIAIFIYAFMRLKARTSHITSIAGAAAFVFLLGILADRLALLYPQGLLQDYLTLPWPFQ